MTLADKLNVWQNDLIDMSRRNALLYYKLTGPRLSGLSLQDADVSSLYDLLVKKRGELSETTLHLPDPDDDPAPMKRLERLRVQARDDAKERGVQSLYIAFGLLEWYEADQSEESILSPLLLVPVAITSGGARSRYTIRRVEDEDIEINPTLHERLRSGFHLTLPTWADIVERQMQLESEQVTTSSPQSAGKKPQQPAPSLDAVFDALRDALATLPDAKRRNWSVRPEAHLGRFSFQKLVMRQDLEHHQQEALAHPLLRRIAGERDALKEPTRLVGVDELDTRVRPSDMLEILDADSSQQEAIQAAKAGQSFVLQGPPGTGKSQTIANIIAECLGQGKTVLFVSEKMAALEVVRKRLQLAGLGEFLLDLHDTKQDKRAFVNELKQAVQQAQRVGWQVSSDTDWRRESEALEARRDQLNTYVRQLHIKRFALDINVHEVYGRLAQLVAVQASDFALDDDVRTITARRLDEVREALRQLLDFDDVLDSYWAHPWRETPLTALTSEQSTTIETHFDRLAHGLAAAENELAQVRAALGEPDALITFGWASYASERARLALTSPLPPQGWFDMDTVVRLRPDLTYARTAADLYQRALRMLESRYRPPIYLLDHQSILNALTDASVGAMATIRADDTTDPQDVALMQRGPLDQRLTASATTLRHLLDCAAEVAATLSLPAPETLDGIETLLTQATLVAETPTPPRSWLDPDAYAEARIAALEAADKSLWAQQARDELSATYAPGYLDADLKTIGDRFGAQYDSFLRYVHLQYYLDVRTLRRYALEQQPPRAVDALKRDVATAIKLRETEQWREDHRSDYARLLGRHYSGEQTDWAQARRMVEWTDRYHSLFSDDTATEAVSKLIVGPESARSALGKALAPLARQWSIWQEHRSWLDATFQMSALTDGASDDGRGVVRALTDALEDLHQTLQQYWQAIDQVAATRIVEHACRWRDLVADVRQAQVAHAFDEWVAERQAQFRADLGADFKEVVTDWGHACDMLDWVEDFMRLYPNGVPQPLVRWVARGDGVQQREAVHSAITRVESGLREIEDELQYAETVIPRSRLSPSNTTQDDTALCVMRQRVELLREQLPLLTRWVACGERILRCRAQGMGALIDTSLKRDIFPRDIVRIFERRFYSLWLDAALAESPALRQFAGETQDRVIQQFRQLDTDHMRLAQRRVVRLLRQRRYEAQNRANSDVVSDDADELEFQRAYSQLVREASKKRSPAIREIVRKVGPALVELMPCWMMSPLTVSQFVAAANPVFDLVIFDEASQVLTEDAICAIMRGKQLIVVGDEKQLPPTGFFAKSLSDTDDDDDDDMPNDSAEQERTESILMELGSANVTRRSLQWHYRSQHESLIAFSNSEFYEGQLITFPGPAKEHRDGVQFEYVADGVYDYGVSRTNRREAERVVDLVIECVQRSPDASLGVVALSGAQQNAIREALAARFTRRPELRALSELLNEDSTAESAFFIKNLESVQGDERDIIVLSIGYGRDKRGQVHANFGPVNKKGGERRLNVAVTRARQRMIVVSSVHYSDINPTQSVGVRTLRRYLNYAEHGPVALTINPTAVPDAVSAMQFDSPFEQAIYEALTAKGIQLDTQVGCSGYRIDLAARDPEQPDRYVLGIECDGASYHSSKTARDRDRLRQAHLESLGWTIHRIWSSDWFAHPERELQKTLDAIALARQKLVPAQSSKHVS